MIKRLLSLKKKSAETEEYVALNLADFIDKYKGSDLLDSEVQEIVTACIIGKRKVMYLTNEKNAELEAKLKAKKEKEHRIALTSRLNTAGIANEKAGNIDQAIKIYEENIKYKHPAPHAFERLMSIYHERKEYANELRVIEQAIEVFAEQNELRFQKALSNSIEEEEKQLIIDGYEKCERVIGLEGWVVYKPHPVKTYKENYDKAMLLMHES